jgi:2-hydroxy-6-oxonona-2,4-dienedioate hydrolase
MQVLRKLLSNVLLACLILFAFVFIDFHWWRNSLVEELEAVGERISTSRGFVEYQSSGSDDAHTTLLLLHGTTGGYDGSQLMAEWMNLDDTVRTIAVSRPGYLGTPVEVGMTPSEAADAFIALMDSLSIENAAVMGWSGGGPMALELANKYPDRISGLILLSAQVMWDEKSAYFPKTDPYEDFDPSMVPVSDSFFGPEFRNYRNARWYALAPWSYPEVEFPDGVKSPIVNRSRYDEVIVTTNPGFNRMVGMYNDAWNSSHLEEAPELDVKTPTLVIHSPLDSRVSFKHAEYIAEHVPGAELFVVENESHYSTLNDAAISRIRSFLGDLDW